jgi:hypothetical protein
VNPSWISPQHCTLEYRNDHRNSLEPKASQLILGALLQLNNEDDQYRLELFINPKWPEFVHEEDRKYIESLLKDLVERAQPEPEMLFKQLCSLGVGPIVTVEVRAGLFDASSRLSLERLVQV